MGGGLYESYSLFTKSAEMKDKPIDVLILEDLAERCPHGKI